MAKDRYVPIDFSNSGSDWAAAQRKSYLEQQDAEDTSFAQANALAEKMRKDGASEQEIDQAVLQVANGQDVSTASQPLPVVPTAQSVQQQAPVAQPNTQGFLGSLVDRAQSSVQNTLGSAIGRAAESDNPLVRALGYIPATAAEMARNGYSPEAIALGAGQGDLRAAGRQLRQEAQANVEATQGEYDRLGSRNWLVKNLGQGVLDAAGSASSAASLVGGPFGGISVLDAYDQAYTQAVDAGVDDPEDRELWALSQAAPELVSVIPAGKVLQRLPVVGKLVDRLVQKPIQNVAATYIERMGSPALKATMRALTSAAGEAVEEGATQAAQGGLAGLFANEGTGQLQELGRQQAPSDLGGDASNDTLAESIWKAARAGAIMGGALDLPHTVHTAVSEDRANRAEWQDQFNRDVANNLEAVIPRTAEETPAVETATQRALDVRNQNENINRELYNASEDVRQDEARRTNFDSGFTQAETEAAQRKADEEEAGFRTIERQRAGLDSQFGALSDIPVTPEQVASEREPLPQREIAPAVEAVAQQVTVAKKAVKKAVKTSVPSDREINAELKRMGFSSYNVPGVGDIQIAMDRINDRKNSAPKKIAKKAVAPKTEAPVETPKPYGLDIARLLSSKNAEDRKLAQAAQDLGLGQASEGITTPTDNDVETTRAFTKKVDSLGEALSGNRKAANQIGRLVNQGKLVIAPNAQSIGRNDYSRSAEYDTGDGKMYVYTDHLSDNPVQDLLVAAPHEGTHAGTFNAREDRGQVMSDLMGDEAVINAAGKLRTAANGGNKLAQAALRQAQADTQARVDRGEENPERHENKELVAYFVGEAQKARQGTIGSAGGAMRDMVAGARNVLRDRLGVNLDVSVNDLTSAANSVLDEITKTGTKGKNVKDDSLGIIYPESATDFEQARKEGRVYTSASGNKQFVLSDADAKMKPGAEEKLNKGDVVRLEEIMDHPVLFRNMPAARDVLIYRADIGRNMAQYLPGKDIVEVSDRLVKGKQPAKLRTGILHEMQHWVQDQSDAREDFFDQQERPAAETAAVDRFQKASKANDKAAQAVLDNANKLVANLPTAADKRAAMNVVMDKNLPAHRKAMELIDMATDNGGVPEEATSVVDKFQDSLDEYRDAAKDYNAAERMRRKRYVSRPSEAEAFFTQANVDTRQEDLPVNPELDEDFGTETMANRGNDNQADSLGQAARTDEPSKRMIRNMPGGTLVTSLLRNDKGLGKPIKQAMERASSEVAVYEAEFNKYAGQFDKEIAKLSQQRGTTVEALNQEIEKGMDEIAAVDATPSEYKEAFKKLSSKYGKAGEWLQNLRDLNDQLSMDIVNTYLKDGGKLTTDQTAQLKAVIGNMGRYVHRFYAARQPGDLGKIYQDSVFEAVEKAEKGKKLNAAQKDLLGKWKNAGKVILEQTYIPDDATLDRMNGDKVNYLYKTWFGGVDGGESKEEKIAALKERREEIGPEDLKAKAKQALTDLVRGTEATAATQLWGGSKRDNTILQKRTDIPKPLRELMGEVKDPSAALMVTAAKQAQFVAKTRMFLELKNKANANDLQPPTAGGSKRVLDNNMKPLEGDQYGPLKGWYASPAMRSMIEETQTALPAISEALANGDFDAAAMSLASKATNLWMKGAAAKKSVDIVGNLYRYGLNAAGSPLMLVNNGVFNPASWVRGGKDALHLIRYAASPRQGLGDAEDAVRYNVVDSATVGDLKTLDRGKLENFIREMSGKGSGKFMKAAKKLGLSARETYAMADVWAKIASFRDEVKHLENYYKAAGVSKTEDEIKTEAAETVNLTNISYSNAAPIFKALERGGVSRFGPYMYEVIRSQMANAGQGIYEMYRGMNAPTPAAKALGIQRGARRLLGQAAVWSALGVGSRMLSGSLWGDDEDKKRAAGLYEGSENSDYIPVGKSRDGKAMLIRASDVDPIGPATDIMRAAMNGDSDAFDRALEQFKQLYIEPSLAVQGYQAIFEPNRAGRKDPLIKDVAPRVFEEVLNVTGNENRVKSLINLAEGFLPGTIRAWGSNNPFAAEPVSDKTEDQVTTGAFNVMNLLGARAVKFDPQGRIGSAGWDYSDKIKDLRTDFGAYLIEHPNATPEEVLERATDYAKDEREEWRQLKKLRDGALALGYSEEDVDKLLKESRVPVAVVAQLREGQFSPRLINKASIQNAAQKSMKGMSDREKQEAAARWERVWEILEPYGVE